jgi:CubicO group peptidase (beta-lactamase class C family)
LAFGLLSEALMNAYHARTWAEVMEKEVTQPIGMRDTTPFITPELKSRVPLWYDKTGEETDWRNPAFPAVNGAGALYSDLDDMMKYLAYMMRGAKDGDPIVSLMLQPHNPMKKAGQSVGLAWQVLNMSNGKTVVDKDGAFRGSVAYMGFVKGGNIGLVFLSNARFPCVPPCRKFLAKLEKLPEIGEGDEEEGGE